MRRGLAEAPLTQQQARESAEERDERMEMRWVYDRRGETSTPVFVSIHVRELAEEFFEWRKENHHGGIWDSLPLWEVVRFGAPLDRASHGMLRLSARACLSPEDGGRKVDDSPREHSIAPALKAARACPIRPGEGAGTYIERLGKIAYPVTCGALPAEVNEMPTLRKGRRAIDARLMALEAQAATMRKPGAEG